MGKFIRVGFLGLLTVVGIGTFSDRGECSKCKAVDCQFDHHCGYRCSCIKLNGNIKGQCVERF